MMAAHLVRTAKLATSYARRTVDVPRGRRERARAPVVLDANAMCAHPPAHVAGASAATAAFCALLEEGAACRVTMVPPFALPAAPARTGLHAGGGGSSVREAGADCGRNTYWWFARGTCPTCAAANKGGTPPCCASLLHKPPASSATAAAAQRDATTA